MTTHDNLDDNLLTPSSSYGIICPKSSTGADAIDAPGSHVEAVHAGEQTTHTCPASLPGGLVVLGEGCAVVTLHPALNSVTRR